ncbi:hypothetical protein MMC20_000409 [Loxospora ochrophaea]|nr:hypothetical protein [Loxospora ochrophaea]
MEDDGQASYDYDHKVTNIRMVSEDLLVEYEDQEGNSRSTRADMVIGADGPSSTVRKILLPTIRRDYVGYVAWRGTIPELEASSLAKSTFLEKITYFHVKGMHILLYTIPGEKGAIEPGKRLLNYVWYCNYAQDSKEFAELMTDSDGNSHRITLPVGKLRPEVWNRQRDLAKKTLPALFSEIVCKTKQPFVQAITDVISSKNSFFDGKVLLVGDSIAGFRPHLGASTSQAAFDSQMLDKLMRGQLSLNEWEMETMRYARTMQEQSVDLGQLCQFGDHPMAQW